MTLNRLLNNCIPDPKMTHCNDSSRWKRSESLSTQRLVTCCVFQVQPLPSFPLAFLILVIPRPIIVLFYDSKNGPFLLQVPVGRQLYWPMTSYSWHPWLWKIKENIYIIWKVIQSGQPESNYLILSGSLIRWRGLCFWEILELLEQLLLRVQPAHLLSLIRMGRFP